MAHNLTLYTFGTTNGWKASITLEELGLAYQAQSIDIFKNVQKEPWFLEINPNGKIPALKDGDQRVFESGAIMLYLVDSYDKDNTISYPHGCNEYYEMLSWLMFHVSGLGPIQGKHFISMLFCDQLFTVEIGLANHFRCFASVRSDYAIDRCTNEIKRMFSVLESRLSSHDYLVGNKYTIADIANFSVVRVAWILELNLDEFPAIKRWVDRIEAREAVKTGVMVPASAMSTDRLVEMFGKMKAKIDSMQNSDKH